MKKIAFILIVLQIVSFKSTSQTNKTNPNSTSYPVTKISGEIIFDGIPDEAAWESIEALPLVM